MTPNTGLRRFVGQPAGAGPPAGDSPGIATGSNPQQAGHPWQRVQPGEHCGLCAKPIAGEHQHIADLEHSTLVCACRACYLLFTHDRPSGRYRAIPDRYLQDPSHVMSMAEWDELEIPVAMAFFLRSSRQEQISGFYPSPAGATECVLELAAWRRLARAHPLLRAAEPDVEAILICRTDGNIEYFLVPIDACYELVGRMRLQWRGFDGGAEARASIERFLADVRERAGLYAGEPADG
ncbi:MAG TPA: DUF5947 family protein [Streptosporangiaceae bacterium]|nr:DUF5947 family protein [Streptosporangiaceae bacterium]